METFALIGIPFLEWLCFQLAEFLLGAKVKKMLEILDSFFQICSDIITEFPLSLDQSGLFKR
jgi:hypothetical protein